MLCFIFHLCPTIPAQFVFIILFYFFLLYIKGNVLCCNYADKFWCRFEGQDVCGLLLFIFCRSIAFVKNQCYCGPKVKKLAKLFVPSFVQYNCKCCSLNWSNKAVIRTYNFSNLLLKSNHLILELSTFNVFYFKYFVSLCLD